MSVISSHFQKSPRRHLKILSRKLSASMLLFNTIILEINPLENLFRLGQGFEVICSALLEMIFSENELQRSCRRYSTWLRLLGTISGGCNVCFITRTKSPIIKFTDIAIQMVSFRTVYWVLWTKSQSRKIAIIHNMEFLPCKLFTEYRL